RIRLKVLHLQVERAAETRGLRLLLSHGFGNALQHERVEKGKLAQSFYGRVTGQDLLKQGGTRARQSDDENGGPGVAAPAGALFEKLAGEQRLAIRTVHRERLPIHLHTDPAQSIAR